MSNAGELYYAGYKGSAILGMEDNTALFSANENLQATKTVSVDPDNKVSVVYQTLSGQTIATCLSGQPLTQKVMQTMSYAGERGVSLHLPPACNSTLKFPIPAEAWSHGIRDQFNGSGTAQIDYKITDLSTGKLLTPGTDYTFNRNNRVVTFKPNYQNRHLFLRVSFNYNAANSGKRSDLAVSYELDYDYWSLSFYDTKGQLVRSVPPHAINCNYNPLANNTLTNSYSTYDILAKGPAVNQLLETTSLASQGGFDQNLFYSVQALSKPNGSSGGTGSQSTRSSLNAVSVSGDPIDNASIISAIESAGVQTRQFYDLNLTDPDMIHFWGKVELTFHHGHRSVRARCSDPGGSQEYAIPTGQLLV
ncbi:MAG: hypothetical protein IPL27_23055 [Lewinellaceae bacterium]|nr:hypothetical protein [Lewinellaceae bacterium]